MKIITAVAMLALLAPAGLGQALPGELPRLLLLPSSGNLFRAISGAGDLDGDGRQEVAIGGLLSGTLFPGRVEVYRGSDGWLLHSISAPPGGSFPQFGQTLAAAGDVNADGLPDLVVGCPFAGSPGFVDAGSVLVFSGLDGSLLLQVNGTTSGQRLGFVVRGAGDVDGDGHADVAASSPGVPLVPSGGMAPPGPAGRVEIFSGATGAMLRRYDGVRYFGGWGDAFDAGLDVDGDGTADIAIGEPDHLGPNGTVHVISGATGAPIFSAIPAQFLGRAVALLDDVDGDGGPDIVAGGGGFAIVYSGATGVPILPLAGNFDTLSRGGDADGDGAGDFATSVFDPAILSFSAQMRCGATGAILAECDYAGESRSVLSGAGAVAGVGDVNGDGFDDLGVMTTDILAIPGPSEVNAVCGAQVFGETGGPIQGLALAWSRTAGASGVLACSGAAPLSSGLMVASVARDFASPLGAHVLVDVSPGAALIAPIPFDGTGVFAAPLGLRVPGLAGVTLHLQAAQLDPSAPLGGRTSNGLSLHFCP